MDTLKRERKSDIALKIVIKSQGKRAKEEEENKKNPQKRMNKMAVSMYLSII